jgi:hypothetical protein
MSINKTGFKKAVSSLYNCRMVCNLLRIFSFLKFSGDISDAEVIDRQSSFLHFGQTSVEQSKLEVTFILSENPQTMQPIVTSSFITASSIKNVCSDFHYILCCNISKEQDIFILARIEQLFGKFTLQVVESLGFY